MTISNGNPILAADLSAMTNADLALVRTDNAQLPLGHLVNFQFKNLVFGTAPNRSKCRFVIPFDCFIECSAVQTGDVTNASTLTLAFTGDGALPNFPVQSSLTLVNGLAKASRVLFDATKGRAGPSFMPLNRALRVWTKGATITMTVSTASVATPSMLQILLVMRQHLARD